MHFNNQVTGEPSESNPNPSIEPSNNSNILPETYLLNQNASKYVLLLTANIIIYSKKTPVVCRALLDSGSQSNYMTTELADRLNLGTNNINMPVSGISKNLIRIKHSVKTTINSLKINYSTYLNFLILDKITENLPRVSFDSNVTIDTPKNIYFADKYI